MLLKKFKGHILYKDFHKKLTASPNVRVSSSKKIKTIGVLTTVALSSELMVLHDIKNSFTTAADIKMYSFSKFTKNVSSGDSCFTEKDFNWRGSVNDSNLESFLETPFDLLIGYFDQQHLFLELAVFKSSATFKIGFSDVNDALYDMIVHEDINNISRFNTLIMKYLNILKKL